MTKCELSRLVVLRVVSSHVFPRPSKALKIHLCATESTKSISNRSSIKSSRVESRCRRIVHSEQPAAASCESVPKVPRKLPQSRCDLQPTRRARKKQPVYLPRRYG